MQIVAQTRILKTKLVCNSNLVYSIVYNLMQSSWIIKIIIMHLTCSCKYRLQSFALTWAPKVWGPNHFLVKRDPSQIKKSSSKNFLPWIFLVYFFFFVFVRFHVVLCIEWALFKEPGVSFSQSPSLKEKRNMYNI